MSNAKSQNPITKITPARHIRSPHIPALGRERQKRKKRKGKGDAQPVGNAGTIRPPSKERKRKSTMVKKR